MDELVLDKLQFYGKRWFARISLALAVLFMVPTVAIMATWNTLPGDNMYPVKRYLEGIALKLVGNNFTVRADLQSQFVDQRFHEATTLLTESSSTAGLSDLVIQIQASKTDIVAAKTKAGGKNTVVAKQKSAKLVTQLKEYNQKLEATKPVVQLTTTTTTPAPTSKPTQTNPSPATASPTSFPTSSPTPKPSPAVTPPVEVPPVDPIEEVQLEIEQVIIELEAVQGMSSVESESKDLKNDKNIKNRKIERDDRDTSNNLDSRENIDSADTLDNRDSRDNRTR